MKEKSDSEATKLAKVLCYYRLIYDIKTPKQKIVCPFHDGDINPSLLVDLTDGRWFCFGCQVGGDAAKIVELMEKKHNGLNDLQSYIKYLKILSSDKHSDIKVNQKIVGKNRKPKKQLYDQSYDYYHGLKTIDWKYDDSEEVASALEYMQKRGYSAETLNSVKAKITYNESYMLIFPMLDNGKFRGWVSRTMKKDIESKRKYLYNDGFSRATTLVGNYGKQDYVIVVEGYMDRLRFIEFGVKENVVAILGWKISQQQEEKLRNKGIKKIISCLDNDNCGRKGTIYLKSVFGPSNIIRWSYLKGIKDPGEMDEKQFWKMYNKTMRKYKE